MRELDVVGRAAASEGRVLAANRRFYDAVADVYTRVDRRRGPSVDHAWLERVLGDVRRLVDRTSAGVGSGPHLLDAGAGSGFLAERAARWFPDLTLVDASPRMLEKITLPGATKICADVCRMPVADGSVDAVGAFATLHHLESPRALFAEAFRVLRPGGVLYTDHDPSARSLECSHCHWRRIADSFGHSHGYSNACRSRSPTTG